MPLKYNGKNIILAKNLRKNATPQENRLWYDFLAKYEVRFQRQKAIDNFIADFCHRKEITLTEKHERKQHDRHRCCGVARTAQSTGINLVDTAKNIKRIVSSVTNALSK